MATRERGASVARLFAVYAAASLIPLVALGVVLSAVLHHVAQDRGIAEARAQSALLAASAIAPLFNPKPLPSRLGDRDNLQLQSIANEARSSGQVLRMRLRNLAGHVVFSSDGTGAELPADDEVVEAVHGEVVASLTRLNGDAGLGGPRVAEVYLPLVVSGVQTGVVEVYLPYAPIARDVSDGMRAMTVSFTVGLVLLYAVLATISYSLTRRLRRQAEHNTYLAEHDRLTGLPNRFAFQRRVEQACAQATRDGPVGAVAVVDLDRFKQINDTLGHHNGDALLVEVANRLHRHTRAGDVVARLGGDEFGILLTDLLAVEEAELALERLQTVLQQDAEIAGIPLNLEASIGFAVFPDDGADGNKLLQCADVAMYVAKGDNGGVVRFRPTQEQFDATELALIGDLRRALSSDELVLHYQPKAEVATGAIVAVEALLRWDHPHRGLIYPDAFIPAAEQTSLIDEVTQWVLHRALRQLQDWGEPASRLAVAVNVSARNLSRPDFADSVLATLGETGVAAERLLLEITETALLADPVRAGITLTRLAKAGVRMSLDDFGRGQTSLGYLSELPIREVKIDKSFVLDMLSEHSHAAIVRSIIDLGHNLGVEVVAEGVETDAVLHALAELHCDVAQGYLLARPMPGEQLPGWLARHQPTAPLLA